MRSYGETMKNCSILNKVAKDFQARGLLPENVCNLNDVAAIVSKETGGNASTRKKRWRLVAAYAVKMGLLKAPSSKPRKPPKVRAKAPRVRSVKSAKARSFDEFNAFYQTKEWRQLRFKALLKYGRACMCCRATDAIMHVDHIKPRSKFPELELCLDNLQILCEDCNMGKGGWSDADFRPADERVIN